MAQYNMVTYTSGIYLALYNYLTMQCTMWFGHKKHIIKNCFSLGND